MLGYFCVGNYSKMHSVSDRGCKEKAIVINPFMVEATFLLQAAVLLQFLI